MRQIFLFLCIGSSLFAMEPRTLADGSDISVSAGVRASHAKECCCREDHRKSIIAVCSNNQCFSGFNLRVEIAPVVRAALSLFTCCGAVADPDDDGKLE